MSRRKFGGAKLYEMNASSAEISNFPQTYNEPRQAFREYKMMHGKCRRYGTP